VFVGTIALDNPAWALEIQKAKQERSKIQADKKMKQVHPSASLRRCTRSSAGNRKPN